MYRRESTRWEELVQRIQAGDSAAGDELARIFYPHVMAMAASRLRNLEMARDVAQDTLLGVLEALKEGRLRDQEKLPGFVIKTALNLIKNRIRRQIQHQDAISLNQDDGLIPDEQESVRALAVEEEERRALVRRALQKMKSLDRQILFLTLAEGMNPRDIAVELGLKPENVRNRKSRALRIVQQKVQKMIRKDRPGHE